MATRKRPLSERARSVIRDTGGGALAVTGFVTNTVSRSGALQSTSLQNRHHRAPVREGRLEQVEPDEQREPEEAAIDIDTEQHAQCDEGTSDQPERTFDSHDDLL